MNSYPIAVELLPAFFFEVFRFLRYFPSMMQRRRRTAHFPLYKLSHIPSGRPPILL